MNTKPRLALSDPETQSSTDAGLLRRRFSSFRPHAAFIAAFSALALTVAVPVHGALVGHWTFDDENNPWQETSGYKMAGVHDGVPINAGGTTQVAAWSSEGHGGLPGGGSLDLTAGNCGLRVMNTSRALDAGYESTFDDALVNAMSIAFWAKGWPDTWAPWISKNGEAVGYQVRRHEARNSATFSLRGTNGEDDPGGTVNSSGTTWHHYAAVWDGINGTRQLYVDGVLSVNLTGDFSPYSFANDLCLVFGARDWDGGAGGNFYAWTRCKLDDIRIYDGPLTAAEVQQLAAQEAGTALFSPQFVETLPGQKTTFTVSLAAGALQAGSVTVWVTNSNPAAVTITGAAGNVLTLNFAQGSANVRTFQVISAGPGTANLTMATSAGDLANSASILVDTPVPPALVGLWTFNDTANPYAETSGYRPAGTHDGQAQNDATTSTEIPAGTTGYSLDLTQGGSIRIANSANGDANYQPTFDDLLMSRMTVALWVKIANKAGAWGPFVVKNGEGAGFQVRLNGGDDRACFTVRGTDGPGDDAGAVNINDGQWHHIAAVRDALSGLRMFYVDGHPDQASILASTDTGFMQLASGDVLLFGSVPNGRQFSGYIKEVRIYNYPLTRAQIQSLLPASASTMIGHWTFDASAPLADTAGFKPAGTHDLLPSGTAAFSTDVPPGRTGQSLDLTSGSEVMIVSNSNQRLGGSAGPEPFEPNPTWQTTFDSALSWQMSIAFWAKGFPAASNPWISKNGGGFGYQVRRYSGDPTATFTLNGTSANDDPAGSINVDDSNWHHYAAVWDGIAGTRQLYVDGVVDPGVNLTGDFGPNVNIANWEYLVLGGRDSGGIGSFTPCLLNDVRIYDYPLTQAEVQALLPNVARPTLLIRNAGTSGLRISWPAGSLGYRLEKSTTVQANWSDAGLTVVVEGNESVAYTPPTGNAQFFRLVK